MDPLLFCDKISKTFKDLSKTLNLIGWQTEDIYQNLTITFISSIKINQKINQKLFILPNSN